MGAGRKICGGMSAPFMVGPDGRIRPANESPVRYRGKISRIRGKCLGRETRGG